MTPIVDVGDLGDVVFFSRCQLLPRSRKMVLTCGRCGRGVIEPEIRYACLVCDAIVLRVSDP